MIIDFNKSDDELNSEINKANDEYVKNQTHVKRVLRTIFTLALLVAGLTITYFIYASYQEEYSRQRMLKSGVETDASLMDTYTEKRWSNGNRTYVVDYKFVVNGSTYYGTSEVRGRPSSYEAVVVYDPQNPTMSQMKNTFSFDQNSSSSSGPAAKAVYYVVLFLILGGVCKWMAKNQ
jgi:hypothetical protein